MQALEFVGEARKLREAARRARRLASTLIQDAERLRLRLYADELDARADGLELNFVVAADGAAQPCD